MSFTNLIWIFGLIFLVGLGIYVYLRARKLRPHSLMVDYEAEPDPDSAIIVKPRQSEILDWPAIRETLERRKTRIIILVHGTFAGTDPSGLLKLMSLSGDSKSPDYGLASKWSKLISDKILRDIGNFTEEYRCKLASQLGQSIPTTLFNWSSENHHMARLIAAANLITRLNNLSEELGIVRGEHILLVGHSHAGQVFALASHLLAHSPHAPILRHFLKKSGHDTPLGQYRGALNNAIIDYVTMGAPPRYEWATNTPGKVLHIINHRRSDLRAGSLKGIWQTRDGDYIQQLGIAGSDLASTSKSTNILNGELETFLGPGSQPMKLQNFIRKKRRLVPGGLNLLVDFGDRSRLAPNAQKSLLGHGCYTQLQNMQFVFNLIAKHL